MKTSPLKVFVSMPFTGKTWEAITEERKGLQILAEKYGVEIVEQFIGYQGKEDFENKDYNPSFILAKDKNFIKEADVIIADFSSPSVGTDCEVTIAKELFDKKVYGVVPKEKRRHMWLIFYCDHFFDTVEEAFNKVREDFGTIHQIPRMDRRQYDPIALEYRLVEETPAQKYIYDPAVTEVLKREAVGKNVVVLHNGSGYRSRLAKKAGAAQVTGIDISYKQTQIAKGEELRESLGIDYLVLDPYSRDFASSVPPELIGNTDVVLGAFLLDHAMTREELELVARSIQILLKPGGIFFGLSDHPEVQVPTDSKYGVVVGLENEIENKGDGTQRRISIFQTLPGGQMEVLHFHNFLWTQTTVADILSKTGFTDIEFHVAPVSEEGVGLLGEEFWAAYNANPGVLAFSARKI
jgi:2-polyprenyl-3-methyl-5-hydroxy-6-metoxy-1,4-benzoquinol methylase